MYFGFDSERRSFWFILIIVVHILFGHFCLLGFVHHGPSCWGLVQDMRPLFIAKWESQEGRLFADVWIITVLLIEFLAAWFLEALSGFKSI